MDPAGWTFFLSDSQTLPIHYPSFWKKLEGKQNVITLSECTYLIPDLLFEYIDCKIDGDTP
jgi:hypothetical protein